jgi:hypothetical protein
MKRPIRATCRKGSGAACRDWSRQAVVLLALIGLACTVTDACASEPETGSEETGSKTEAAE